MHRGVELGIRCFGPRIPNMRPREREFLDVSRRLQASEKIRKLPSEARHQLHADREQHRLESLALSAAQKHRRERCRGSHFEAPVVGRVELVRTRNARRGSTRESRRPLSSHGSILAHCRSRISIAPRETSSRLANSASCPASMRSRWSTARRAGTGRAREYSHLAGTKSVRRAPPPRSSDR